MRDNSSYKGIYLINMNNDNLKASPQQKEEKLRKKSAYVRKCKDLPKCEDPDPLEQNEISPSSSFKCKLKRKAKREKSLKHNPKIAVDSYSPLCNLIGDENMISPIQQKIFPRRSQRLSLISNNNLKISSEKNTTDCCSKSLNLNYNLKDNKSDVCISPEEITNLIYSVSLAAKHSMSTDGSFVDNEEIVNSSTTNITFSPVCSSRESISDDLKNNVTNIIETLTEEQNENVKVSRRLSNSSPDNEECSHIKNTLKGVIAYVEVRSGHENRTKAVERQLHQMGAKIIPRFLSVTTHVIFKEGRKSTRDKAIARNIPLVSVLWVESCKQQRRHVPEADFPANIPEIYDSPLLCRRIRKLKSMQPKDFNIEFAGSVERLNKIFSRIRQDNEYYSASDSFCGSETSISIKDDDTASDDNVDCTPMSCKMPVAVCRLFDSPANGSKSIQQEIVTSNKHEKTNSNPSAIITDVTVKRRKLFSDLNRSPQLVINTPKCVTKVKSNSTSRRKRQTSKEQVQTSLKWLTDVRNENAHTENNKSTNSTDSVMTDSQHKDEKDLMSSDSVLANLKQNSRNSMDDFEDKKHRKEKSYKTKCSIGNSFDSDTVNNTSLNKISAKKATIVLTSLQSTDREVIYSIIESLGGFRVKHSVTEMTTHVVSGDNRRTLSVLFGLVRGCWLLSSQWVYKSMEAGHWLEEEPFQLTEYFPASQVSRLECTNHGLAYCLNLFGQLGNIFISSQCTPSSDNLTELIRLAGGKVSSCLRKCVVLIGPHTKSKRESKTSSDIVHLSEKWVLDCISQHKTLPFDEYKI